MKLTGECKEEFEKWFDIIYEVIELPSIDDSMSYSSFKDLPQSMQYGVLVDYFDSLNIIIRDNVEGYSVKSPIEPQFTFISDNGEISNRPEARTKAIEKANEIYNK